MKKHWSEGLGASFSCQAGKENWKRKMNENNLTKCLLLSLYRTRHSNRQRESEGQMRASETERAVTMDSPPQTLQIAQFFQVGQTRFKATEPPLTPGKDLGKHRSRSRTNLTRPHKAVHGGRLGPVLHYGDAILQAGGETS